MNDFQGIFGAVAQTITKPIAQVISNELRFPIDDLQSAFSTVRDTFTTTRAFLFVDFNDFPDRHVNTVNFSSFIFLVISQPDYHYLHSTG